MRRYLELAAVAGSLGTTPVGCIVVLDGRNASEAVAVLSAGTTRSSSGASPRREQPRT